MTLFGIFSKIKSLRSDCINFSNLSKSALALGLVLSGSSFLSNDISAQTHEKTFDFVQKAEEQGFAAEKVELENYIQSKADSEGKTYQQVSDDLYQKTKSVHEKYSDKPLYNDLSYSKTKSTRNLRTTTNAVSLSSVVSSYAMSENDYLLTNTEEVVDGEMSIEYGVDTVVYSSGSFREFVSVDTGSAFVQPNGTGVHSWSPAYETAEKESSSVVNFRAYGNIESQVSQSVSAGFQAVGFSVSSSSGSTVTLRKSHQIDHNFTLY